MLSSMLNKDPNRDQQLANSCAIPGSAPHSITPRRRVCRNCILRCIGSIDTTPCGEKFSMTCGGLQEADRRNTGFPSCHTTSLHFNDTNETRQLAFRSSVSFFTAYLNNCLLDTNGLHDLLEAAMRHARKLTSAERGSIFVIDEAAGRCGPQSPDVDKIVIPIDKGIVGSCYESRIEQIVDDVTNIAAFLVGWIMTVAS